MNLLNLINNLSILYIELNIFVPGIIKTLIDGIAFISNMENVLMGNKFYLMENLNEIIINTEIKKNENFKILINNYILQEYFIYNNYNEVKILKKYNISLYFQSLLLHFEIFLIVIQKFIYEYIDYIKHLYNWYSNFNILINKNIINSSINEEIYYNITLELLSDIQGEYNRSLWWSIKNIEKYKKNIGLQIFKNYFQIFKNNPYKTSIELLNLYKNYPRINILSYGLNYDINILTNKYILNEKNNILNNNIIIKNLDKNNILYNNIDIWKSQFKKTNFYKIDNYFKNYVSKFLERLNKDKFSKFKFFSYNNVKNWTDAVFNIINFKKFKLNLNFGIYLPKIEWTFEQYFKMDYVNKILKKDTWWKQVIYHQDFLELWNDVLYVLTGKGRRIKYVNFVWSDFEFQIINWNLKNSTLLNLIPSYFHNIWNFNINSNIMEISNDDLQPLFGGYSYWWAWHQDTSHINEGDIKIVKIKPRKRMFYIIGLKKYYWASQVIDKRFKNIFAALDFNIKHNTLNLNTLLASTSTDELEEMLENKKRIDALYETMLEKKKAAKMEPTKIIEKKVEDDLILEDTTLEDLMQYRKQRNNVRSIMEMQESKEKAKNLVQYRVALKLEKKRDQLDPLGISRKLKKKYRYHNLFVLPDYKLIKRKIPVSRIGINRYFLGKLATDYGKRLHDFNWTSYGLKKKLYLRYILHGNRGWKLNEKLFKIFLKGNDIWIDKSVFNVKGFLEKVKLSSIMGEDYKKLKGKIGLRFKDINLNDKFIISRLHKKFITLHNKVQYMENYKKYIEILKTHAIESKDRIEWYYYKIILNNPVLTKYLKENNIYNKKILNMIYFEKNKNLPSIKYEHLRKILKKENFNNILNTRHKDEYILGIKMKFNTLKWKKDFPIKLWKKWKGYNFYKIRKIFDSYFFPDLMKKTKIMGFKYDFFIKLTLKESEIWTSYLKYLKEGHTGIYKINEISPIKNLKKEEKLDIYKYIFKKNFQIKFIELKNLNNSAINSMRGYLMNRFSFNIFSNLKNMETIFFFKKPSITWDIFYTNIESYTESLNLNIIHKNFYGNYIDKNSFNNFLFHKSSLVSNVVLPRSNNILLKKSYIKDLINIYSKEEKPIINYIFYNIIKEKIIFIHKIIYNIFLVIIKNIYSFIIYITWPYKEIFEFTVELIQQQLLKLREIKRIVNYLKLHPEYYIYLIFIICFFIYVIISSLLILLIKSFLPKNLIYGIKNKKEQIKENIWDPINNNYNININSENLEKQLFELENMMEIQFDRIKIHKDVLKNVKEKDTITTDNLKKIELQAKLNRKIKLKKNFFDAEHKYIYSWNNSYENLNNIEKGIKNLEKIRVYNKFEKKMKKDLKKNYKIFYKTFIFEKNLEKWENNTKIRLDFFFWIKDINRFIIIFIKSLWIFYKDRRYNHNKILFWNNESLDDDSKVTYMYTIPRPFANIVFIIRFIIGAIKLWSISHWINKWTQYVLYGRHVKISYKELRERLERDATLEWYSQHVEYSKSLYYKDLMQIIKKYNNIKKLPTNNEIWIRKKKREEIINNIINLLLEEEKLEDIENYLKDLKKIELDRINGNFNAKFKDIKIRLLLDIHKVGAKERIEQELRHKYRTKIFNKKLENEILKETIDFSNEKDTKIEIKKKIQIIEYEKRLREHNYNNLWIDIILDDKETKYYEAIKEYNEELSEKYLEIEKKQKEEKLKEIMIENRNRKLYGSIYNNFPLFFWFTTMGARTNYLIVLIANIFIAWIHNMKKVRDNEYNLTNIFKVMRIDFINYIYKRYWEYLILWNKYNILKKLGFSIKEILKFSLILTPLIIYSGILYMILIIYIILIVILYIIPKKIYIKIKEQIKKIIKNILIKKIIKIFNLFMTYFVYIWKIINLLFRNIETGNTLFKELYIKFYKYCGWAQYNIYMFKGAFILGYNKEKKIKNGIKFIIKWLILKYNAYLEKKKLEKKKKINFIANIINKRKNIKLKYYLIKFVLHKYIVRWRRLKRKIIIPLKIIRIKIKNYIYEKIVYKFFYKLLKIKREEFDILFNQNIQWYKEHYKKNLEEWRLLFKVIKKIKTKDFFILIIKLVWKILKLPFVFIINHQKAKYIKNYKQGIQGFRDNPMHLILDNPKRKYDWKIKLHTLLMENKISSYLASLIKIRTNLVEIFFMYKISEVIWTKKNYYQDFFWRKWYWRFKKYKKIILTKLADQMREIEDNYISFEESIETQNFSLWERLIYAYHSYKMYFHLTTRVSQRRKSRDIFFYKKAKDRDKLLRIYFFKGLINWITYLTINKIFFVKIKNLKYKEIKYKHIKYILKNINARIHITEYMEEIPPQFWALIILYNKYYRFLLRYRFEDGEYPKKWDDSKKWIDDKSYKWRLASPEHNFEIPFYQRRFIAADINTYHFTEFVSSLANEPYDPMLRWMIFLLEYGMTTEDIVSQGNDMWINSQEDYNVWGDISLTHLLTYNVKLDEYKYEIKDFNRLIKGFNFLNILENTLERDKVKHYQDRFKLVSNTIMMKNEDILNSILKQRRLKRAKMLHKALINNRLKSKSELEEEKEQENKKEYFYIKKKEFFEDLFIEEYWDWQAQYDEGGVIEDKYFNSKDLWDKTYQAHSDQEFYLDNGKLVKYDYLLNHIVLKSFDQTIEEIHYFLVFKAWKILEKNLKKEKKRTEINYKHLNINNSNILSKINYTEHLKIKKETKNKQTKEYFIYKYKKLEWEPTKTEALYGFTENNILFSYYEIGYSYTYEHKIEYNEEALRYIKPSKIYHGQEKLSWWRNIWENFINTRIKTLKNIKKIYIKKKKRLPLNLAYINNIKWTWEQWIIYIDINKENEFLNKNIIILNERFRLWNLKRVPIRIKLPVILDVDLEYVGNYFKDKSNYMSLLDHRHMMMTRNITPLLKQALIWEECKIYLEKHFNKNIQDLIIWIFTAELFNREMIKIKRDYQFVLKNFIRNFGVFHKLYFMGMPQYTWDLIRYHQAWWGEDEFPYDRYYQLKQVEFLNHDPGARKIVRKIYKIYLDKFAPISYIYFFKKQFFANYLYNTYGILSFGCFLWTMKVLLYNSGEYLSENYMLFVPMLLTLAFWHLRRSLRDVRDVSKGLEIYLYRYRSSKLINMNQWLYYTEKMDNLKKEWIRHFYDRDKIQEVFGSLGENALDIKRDPEWWRYHTHRDKNSKIYSYEHTKWWIWVSAAYFLSEYWKNYKFKYRNSKWLWEYYKHNSEMLEIAKRHNVKLPHNYKERDWLEDSWTRLEQGGNWYSRWYENYFRKKKGLSDKPLDYGEKFQIIEPTSTLYKYDNKPYYIPSSYADNNWMNLSLLTDYYNKLPKEYKDFTQELKIKPKVNYKEKIKGKKKYEISKFSEIYDDIKLRKLESKPEDNWQYLKRTFREDKKELKELIKRLYLGERYISKKHPLRKWAELLYWVEDYKNYDITTHIYAEFLIVSQKKTSEFISKDEKRHLMQQDPEIDAIINKPKEIYNNLYERISYYIYNQDFLRLKNILEIKKNSYETGESLSMRTLLSISEPEKHLVNMIYNLNVKNKQYIILRKILERKHDYITNDKRSIIINKIIKLKNEKLKIYQKYNLEEQNSILFKNYWKNLKSNLLNEEIIKYDLFLKKQYILQQYIDTYKNLSIKLKKISKYIENINKYVELRTVTEYRYNLIMKFWKEKKNFWIFIKDFIDDINWIEILNLIIWIIRKIFNDEN